MRLCGPPSVTATTMRLLLLFPVLLMEVWGERRAGAGASRVHGVLVNRLACRGHGAQYNISGGTITSPLRPGHLPARISCTWVLHNPTAGTFILSFSKFDLDEGEECVGVCCPHQWLSVELGQSQRGPSKDVGGAWQPPLYNGTTQNMQRLLRGGDTWGRVEGYRRERSVGAGHGRGGDVGVHRCGSVAPPTMYTSAPTITIKFFSDAAVSPSRGAFTLHYHISEGGECGEWEFGCQDPALCVPRTWRCNGHRECPDGSDEYNCHGNCTGLRTGQWCDGQWDCWNGQDELGCQGCGADEWWCGVGQECYQTTRRCDGIADCRNGADELSCNCLKGQKPCSPYSSYCYDPHTQRCDTVLHCPNGRDEIDCEDKCGRNMIGCVRGGGCYTSSQRCDGAPDCGDASDEAGCTPDLCHTQNEAFLCSNGRCIREEWRCDQLDDCGDGSDEQGCLRNSVIGAAVMGGLVCSLLLVVAVGCTCRLYALRLGIHRLQDQRGGHGQRRLSSLGPLSRLEQHLLQREPPPSYSVAVNDPTTLLFGGSVGRHWRRPRQRGAHGEGGLVSPAPLHQQGAPRPELVHAASRLASQPALSVVGGYEGRWRGWSSPEQKEREERCKVEAFLPVPSSRLQAPDPTDDDDVPLLVVEGEAEDDAQLLDLSSALSGGAAPGHPSTACLSTSHLQEERAPTQGGFTPASSLLPPPYSATPPDSAMTSLPPPYSALPLPDTSSTTSPLHIALLSPQHTTSLSSPAPQATADGGEGCEGEEEGKDLLGGEDMMDSTRAAVMALSEVQRHTHQAWDHTTELLFQ